MKNKFYEELKTVAAEKDVEEKYKNEFKNNLKELDKISSPHKTDGIMEFVQCFDGVDKIKVLMEFKYKWNFSNSIEQAKALIQSLFYIKEIEQSGETIPDVVFVADENECFLAPVIDLIGFLSNESIDWKIPASGAATKYPKLLTELSETVRFYVHPIDAEFKITNIIDDIKNIKKEGTGIKTKIVLDNIQNIYENFENRILKKCKLTVNDKIHLFLQILFNNDDNFLHPNKKNILMSKSFGEISVDSQEYNAFFKRYTSEYYPEEKEKIISAADILIEEKTRRQKGEYYTPKMWVDEAHKMISEQFGEDWKDKYVVWDCAWGTGNLTRDYRFKELYCSTLEQCDLDTADSINPEAIKFQFDFLNDDDSTLPSGLIDALNGKDGKQVIFFINPPYATPTGNSDKTQKTAMFGSATSKDVINNITSEKMRKTKFGGSDQLYIQFLYRMWLLNNNSNIHIAHFIPLLFKTGEKYENCRKHFFTRFKFIDGFIIPASEFSDVSEWPIDFSIWTSGTQVEINQFKMRDKIIYNLDGKARLTDFVKSEGTPKEYPCLSSSIFISEDTKNKGIPEGAIGTFCSVGNMVCYKNLCFILSGGSSRDGGKRTYIYKNNLLKVCCIFCAKRCVTHTVKNDKDCFYPPHENHPKFEQFLYDSVIYSIFNDNSEQSSLRKVEYNEQLWDIKNEFFWMRKDEMKKLANDFHYDDLYKDAKTDSERYVTQILYDGDDPIYDKLSDDAKGVLDFANNLVINSIEHRKLSDKEHPEYHLYCWDAGYAQLKQVWKEYKKEEYKEFVIMYKNFENRMRELVYELGILER